MDDRIKRVVSNIEKVIVGKREVAEKLLVGVLAEGHILLEDVPGTGKTVLAKALARSLDLSFQRIQFTPDLLPSDVTGTTVFNRKSSEFEFRSGPVFSHILLGDEINRASPRTQSALLEAMAERQVSVDGVTHPLPRPFLVIATQNPVEMEGTFPLPEAQLDRFLLKLQIGYPEETDEVEILRRHGSQDPLADLAPVLGAVDLEALTRLTRDVKVSDDLFLYTSSISRGTRDHRDVLAGSSPRGTLALLRAAKALAVVRGRDHLLPDDVKEIAPEVLAHRLILTPEALVRGTDPLSIVRESLKSATAPVEDLT